MLEYILLIVGFVILIKGADLLVDGAVSIAGRLGVSNLVIGLTVVSFGTSAPELFVNVIASARGNTDIAIGNVLGSNVANTLLILGVAAVIYPLPVPRGTVWKEIPFSLLAALVLGVMANDHLIDGSAASVLSRIDGLVLAAFFAIFMYYTAAIAHVTPNAGMVNHPQTQGLVTAILMVAVGLVLLSLGGHWIVQGAVAVARRFNISDALVGLTIVAIGTSLPELATSAVAAFRKNAEIAVGNAVGSNIFNIFFVLSVSAVINPLPFNPSTNIDIVAVILSGLLLFLFMFTGGGRNLNRWEGMVFLFIYAGYIIFRYAMS